MRLSRVFSPGDFTPGEDYDLGEDIHHYLTRVLRLVVGDFFYLINGQSQWLVQVKKIDKKSLTVHIDSLDKQAEPLICAIHLGQGMSKGDRMDFVMQKSVELGVASITPLKTAYCQYHLTKDRFDKKQQHWQEIANAAVLQSSRIDLVNVGMVEAFTDFVSRATADLKLICEPGSVTNWDNYKKILAPRSIVVLIGPEGGFSQEEYELAKAHGFETFSLGPRILRTETAALAALTILQFCFGDI